jgi:propanediol utilization protein
LTLGGRATYLERVSLKKPHSPRFVRVNDADARSLFGGEVLEPRFPISNGRFVARQRVAIVGPRGRIDGVPVVGPSVDKTAISWSAGDPERLGVDARGVIIVGTQGEIKFVDEPDRAAQ